MLNEMVTKEDSDWTKACKSVRLNMEKQLKVKISVDSVGGDPIVLTMPIKRQADSLVQASWVLYDGESVQCFRWHGKYNLDYLGTVIVFPSWPSFCTTPEPRDMWLLCWSGTRGGHVYSEKER